MVVGLEPHPSVPATALTLRPRVFGPALAACCALSTAVLWYFGRGTTFFFDEWDFVIARRTGGIGSFLLPHGGHPSVVPIAIYRFLLAIVGLRHYGVFRATLIGLHLACCALLFLMLRRRLGDPVALVLSGLLLFLGSAWQDLLWPFQMSYLGPLVAGLGVLLILERADLLGDAAAALLLTIAIFSSGIGIAIAAGVLVELLWRPTNWRRVWLAAVPVALFGAWYVAYGRFDSQAHLINLTRIPVYAADSAAAAIGGLTGLGSDWGRPLALVAGGLIALQVVRRGGLWPRLAGLLAMVVVFWALTGLTRAHLDEPGASRYLYPGGLFLLLIAGELLRGIELRGLAMGSLAVAVVIAIVANTDALHGGSFALRNNARTARAELAAVELAQRTVDPAFRPDASLMPQVVTGPYLTAVRALGSPADSLSELRAQPDDTRMAADRVLTAALPVQVSPSESPPGPATGLVVEGLQGGETGFAGGCVDFTPAAPGAHVDVATQAGATVIENMGNAASALTLRRFSDSFPQTALATVDPGQTVVLGIPSDSASGISWHLRISTQSPVRLCGVSPAG